MAWSTPETWSSGQLVTADDLNEQLRDNMIALKDPPTGWYVLNEATNITSTSTSWTDVDSTLLSLDVTTGGGDVMVGFCGAVDIAGATVNTAMFDVTMDGVAIGGDDGFLGVVGVDGSAATTVRLISFVRLVTSVPAGAHQFRLRWRGSNTGVRTLYVGNGASNRDFHAQFWVREVS